MNTNTFLLTVATLLLGSVLCQSENDLVNEIKDKIPGLENFNQSALPQQEEVVNALKEKCDKNGGSFDDIVNSKDYVQTCVEKHVNTTVIMEELEEAKKTGSMDEVFGKYCKKRAEMMECVNTVLRKIEKCLEPSEKENLKIVVNVTESLADFVCFKDGDRLAMFVAEGGFECIQEHRDGIQDCANKTLSGRIPSDLSVTNLPLFVIGQKECDDLVEMQECTVAELEKCKDNTPANIVEALFKFIKRVTPCGGQKPSVARNYVLNDDPPVQLVLDKVKRSQQVEFSFIRNFNSKCYKYGGPAAYRDLEQSVNNMKMCVQTHLRSQNVCGRMSDVRNCTNFAINKLRLCLPPQESYLSAFSLSAVNAVLHYLCDDSGKNFNKLIYSGGLPCLLTNDPKSLNDCLAGTKTRTKDNDIVTKVELCDDLDKIQMCLSTYISNHCSEFKDFKQVTLGIMDAFKVPCAGCTFALNQMALLFSVLLALHHKYLL